jgi:MarR family transcriptional regulator, negative regulator of the multidrug operon emrRAB
MVNLTRCIDMLDKGIANVREAMPDMPAEALLCRLTLLVGDSIRQELEQKLKPHKLNDSDFQTLMILFSRPDGSSTPGELCEYTSQRPTNMTRIANALVKRGLITRGHSAEDRRRVVMRITSAGRRFVQKMLPPMFPRLSLVFAGFSDIDKRHMDKLLRKLAYNLTQLEHAGAPS